MDERVREAGVRGSQLSEIRFTWRAQPGPQTALIKCPIGDVFFGGSRGGGKTDGLLGDFGLHAGKYGKDAKGILFRRTLSELDEVIARSHEIYGPLGWVYQVQKGIWTATNGATLKMRYLDVDADAGKYQGHSYTWEGYDELGEWPSPAPIDKLWACLRSAKGVPCVRRCTGNPGGPGHVWVKKRYRVDQPWIPFEYEPQPGFRDTLGRPLKIQAIFIPSRLDDNPLLMKNDPMYESRLAASGSLELFKAWRYGNWDVLAGQYFDIWNPAEHVVPMEVAKPPAWAKVWISADWGFNDDTVVLWHWADEQKRVHTYRELRVDHATPEEIGRRILELNDDEKPTAFYLSPDAFHKRQSPKTIADGISEVLKGKVPYPAHADDDRVGGWQLMYQMLKTGYWKISSACPTLIDSIPQLIRDTARNPEDIAESPVDHAPDAARYGLKSMVVASRQSMQALTEERLKAIPDETSRAIAWQQEAHRRKRWWQGGKMRARH